MYDYNDCLEKRVAHLHCGRARKSGLFYPGLAAVARPEPRRSGRFVCGSESLARQAEANMESAGWYRALISSSRWQKSFLTLAARRERSRVLFRSRHRKAVVARQLSNSLHDEPRRGISRQRPEINPPRLQQQSVYL